MNIAFVNTLLDPNSCEVIQPMRDEFNVRTFSWLFPRSIFWHCGYNRLETLAEPVDLAIFLCGDDTDRIHAMTRVAKGYTGLKIAYNFDPAGGWLTQSAAKLKNVFNLYAHMHAIATHCTDIVQLLHTLTEKPVFFLGEPNWAAAFHGYYAQEHPDLPRDVVLLPHTPMEDYKANRGTLINFAIAKLLYQETQTQAFKPLRFVAVCGNDGIDRSLGTTYPATEFRKQFGFEFIEFYFNPDRTAIAKLLLQAQLLINMDDLYCLGHWNIDAASFGVPVLTTDRTAAAHLFSTTFDRFDIHAAKTHALWHLSDTHTPSTVKYAQARAEKTYHHKAVRNRLLEGLHAFGFIHKNFKDKYRQALT